MIYDEEEMEPPMVGAPIFGLLSCTLGLAIILKAGLLAEIPKLGFLAAETTLMLVRLMFS